MSILLIVTNKHIIKLAYDILKLIIKIKFNFYINETALNCTNSNEIKYENKISVFFQNRSRSGKTDTKFTLNDLQETALPSPLHSCRIMLANSRATFPRVLLFALSGRKFRSQNLFLKSTVLLRHCITEFM